MNELTITGYMIERTGEFIETRFTVNGNFKGVREELLMKHASEIYFRIEEPPRDIEERIINIVCFEYDTYPEEIFVTSKYEKLVEPRQVIHYLLSRYTVQTKEYIGAITGKHHATVIHSIKTVKNRMQYDLMFRERVHKIEEIIQKFKN